MGLISWAIYAFVIFRVGNRAYASYQHQFTNWPIITGIAILYAIFGAARRLLPLTSSMDTIFWIVSLVCIYGSSALYNHGVRAHNANQNNNNYPPTY